MWLRHGDKNTGFFHQKASHKKSRNWIESIQNSEGTNLTEETQIGEVFTDFYLDLFSSSNPINIDETTNVVRNRLDDSMKAFCYR